MCTRVVSRMWSGVSSLTPHYAVSYGEIVLNFMAVNRLFTHLHFYYVCGASTYRNILEI